MIPPTPPTTAPIMVPMLLELLFPAVGYDTDSDDPVFVACAAVVDDGTVVGENVPAPVLAVWPAGVPVAAEIWDVWVPIEAYIVVPPAT